MEKNEIKTQENTEETHENKEVCPVCGSDAIVVNGRCKTCYSCGYSLCSM